MMSDRSRVRERGLGARPKKPTPTPDRLEQLDGPMMEPSAAPDRLLAARALVLQRLAGNAAVAVVVQRGKGDKGKGAKGGKGGKAKPEPKGKGAKGAKVKPVVEEEEVEDDVEAIAEVEPAPSPTSSAGMTATYDKAVTTLKESITGFNSTDLPAQFAGKATGARNLVAARKALAKIRANEEAVREHVVAIEERADEVGTEAEADEEGGDVQALVDEEDALRTLLRRALAAEPKLDDAVTELEGSVELAAASTAASAALTGLRALWASPALAIGHFSKHKGDTGLATETAYLTRAQALTNMAAGGTISSRLRADGDRLWFDSATGQFAIKSAAGKIRTLFCPARGKRYYDAQ